MVFSSSIFLFAFLPLFAVLYALGFFRNALLLCASLLFYAWGEPVYIVLLLTVCAVNWWLGLFIGATDPEGRVRSAEVRRLALWAAVVFDLAALIYFKYAGFIAENVAEVFSGVGLEGFGNAVASFEAPRLPLGVSFFVFQAITYAVDIYRGDCEAERSPMRVALYISMFPQLVAGPIVRYREVAAQIARRVTGWKRLASGAELFLIGLGKKVLIADTLARPVDAIFAMDRGDLTPGVALLGAVCFAMQILFDFSGYTDMARGIARAMGFDFPENFNRPYLATSVQDFWRRWHMTLSRWFRDYVYIPLGGNRKSATRTYVNLVAVFLLTGAWHGASWTFIAWGLFHGAFLVIERLGLKSALDRVPRVVGLVYLWVVVLVGWVLFRAESIDQALGMMGVMLDVTRWGEAWTGSWAGEILMQNDEWLALAAGAFVSLGGVKAVAACGRGLERARMGGVGSCIASVFLMLVALLSVAAVVGTTQRAFIYFRF